MLESAKFFFFFLRTEMNQKQFICRQRLPRGYFKKRKHEPTDARQSHLIHHLNLHRFTGLLVYWFSGLPPDIAKMTRIFRTGVNYVDCVNTKRLLYCLLVLILWMGAIVRQGNATTIEPDLKVLSLETMAPTTHINGSGNCISVDLKFDIEKLERLRGCRVVEGSVAMVLMDESTEEDFRNFSFPELVEITGYLMLYRISGVKSVSKLFPNLAVIRGRELFKAYSLVIYENKELEDIGLYNLQTIERGHVRIEKNDLLCFADRIDWTLIAGPGEHYIEKNKHPRHCPVCSDECPRSKGNSKLFCWNQKHCQIKCDCKGDVCIKSGQCCDAACVGGCDENNPRKCKACKRFSVGEGEHAQCRDNCPIDTYAYLHRCVTKQECYELSKTVNKDVPNAAPFIPFLNNCMQGCPPTYVDVKNGSVMDCKSCGNECQKKCQAKIIDTNFAAQSLKGCSIIEGPLEIQIRSSKSFGPSSSVVKELEDSLSDIVEIQDYLKIARSFPIQSLSFLKKLKRIKGNRLESNKYSLIIWDNQNLQELWKDQEVEINNGKLFFHMNPKLCFYKIESLTKNFSQIDNYENAKLSNGDKTPCNVTLLKVTIAEIYPQAALLTWDPLKLEDERSLLSYVIYYTPAQHQNVTLWGGRDACGNDGWLVDDVKDFTMHNAISHPLTKLEPYTQYAFYVTAFTLSTEKTGAQSDIQYFRTLPDRPQKVAKLQWTAKSSSAIDITWEPPKKVNGKLSYYILRVQMVETNKQILEQRDYCIKPLEPSETPVVKPDTKPIETPAKAASDIDGHCDCKNCLETCQSSPKEGDDQRQLEIEFEDEIHDFVYVRTDLIEISNKETRAKRQIEFPEENDKETTKKKETETESILNADGEYIYFYKEINDSTQRSFELTQLRHFTQYQIEIRACREKSDSSMKSDQQTEQCGPEAQETARTLKQEQNDKITVFNVEAIKSNSSSGLIRVDWKPPPKPNGLITSYTIRYRKSDIEHTKWEYSCIPHKVYLNQSFYMLKYLSNGNYSIQIAAHSMAGMSNFTDAKYVVIAESTSSQTMWTVLISCLVVLVILTGGLIYFIKRHYLQNITNMKLIASVNPDYAGVQYKQDSWEVPREKIIQLQELGQGSFGMVYEGIVKDLNVDGGETRCAIKTVNENATDKERISFLNEASVMKQFDTAFVVRLLGVVSQSQPTMVIMELMQNGDLKGYLRSHRQDYDRLLDGSPFSSPPPPPTVRQILQMSAEIADGMSYLSAKKFVHRDLAARNCMVGENYTVKIGDFGMTRDIYETDYYRKGTKGLLPVRWMSPESLKDGVFTSSSDVFSFGVVLWEMATLASQPYQGLSNDQVLRYVIDGGVMERPENCPDKLYEMMRRCWQHRPSARPTFMEIIDMLLDEVNDNFRNIAFFFTKEGQDIYHQQRQAAYSVNMTDDVTTPLRQDEDETSSIDGNHFLMEEMNSGSKFHDL